MNGGGQNSGAIRHPLHPTHMEKRSHKDILNRTLLTINVSFGGKQRKIVNEGSGSLPASELLLPTLTRPNCLRFGKIFLHPNIWGFFPLFFSFYLPCPHHPTIGCSWFLLLTGERLLKRPQIRKITSPLMTDMVTGYQKEAPPTSSKGPLRQNLEKYLQTTLDPMDAT